MAAPDTPGMERVSRKERTNQPQGRTGGKVMERRLSIGTKSNPVQGGGINRATKPHRQDG